MQYLEAEISGLKRFTVNKINRIRIVFDKKFHCFLGTNGSGKTSLMKELSPLAAVPANYKRGGFKKVIIRKGNALYHLLSDFQGPKNIFSFLRIVDGCPPEELNPGHTSTVFNNLAFQHFGYTKEVHDFALGLKNFTDLPPSDRKNWLTRWSDADYTYALSYFQKLYSATRDIQGSIRSDQERLLELKGKQMSKEDLNLLEDHLEALNEKRKFLYEIIPSVNSNKVTLREKNEACAKRLSELRESLRVIMIANKEHFPLRAREDYKDMVSSANVQMHLLGENTSKLYNKLKEVEKNIGIYMQSQQSDLKTLSSEKTKLFERLNTLKDSTIYQPCSNPKNALAQFNEWLTELGVMVPLLIPNLNNEYDDDSLRLYQEKLRKHQEFLSNSERAIEENKRKLESAKDCDHSTEETKCPSCNFSWVPGKTQADINQLETLLSDLQERRKVVLAGIDELEEEVRTRTNYVIGMRNYQRVLFEFPLFRPFWIEMESKDAVQKTPEVILSAANSYRQVLEAEYECEKIAEEIGVIGRKEELLRNSSNINIDALMREKEGLTQEIELLYVQRDKAFEEKKNAEFFVNLVESINGIAEESKQMRDILVDNGLESFKHFERERLIDMINEVDAKIFSTEKEIRACEVREGVIVNLEENIFFSTENFKAMKLATDALSPSKGLIARGLTGFINHLVKMVNNVIKTVWLYPMELKAIELDANDKVNLEYKFALNVNGEDVPDISECSSGQKEIINRAFQIVGLAFMKMDHGPLFLDEFGARMDTAHKASSFEMITKLLATSNFSQVFMISHFEGTHIHQVDADITVICGANIKLPPGVNVNRLTTIE